MLFGLALVSPFRPAISEELLQDIETHFAVIQRVTQFATFIEPRRGNPAYRHVEETFDFVIAAARTRIGEDRDVRLAGQLVFRQERLAVFAAVPDRDEIEFHIWVRLYRFQPAAAF